MKTKDYFNHKNILIILLFIINLFVIYNLMYQHKKVYYLEIESNRLKQKLFNINLINTKISYTQINGRYFHLFLIIPDGSCDICLNRVIDGVNKLLEDKVRGIRAFHIGNSKYFSLDLKKLKLDINTIDKEQLFKNKLEFSQPLFLLIRRDGLICDNLLVSSQIPEATDAFLLKMRNFLEIEN